MTEDSAGKHSIFSADGDEYLTLQEAAALPECDIKASSLRMAIGRGRLSGVKRGKTWYVTKRSVILYLNNRKVGRPPREEEDTDE